MTLAQLSKELETELQELLQWWSKYSIDEVNGGFLGAINNQNKANATAIKGLVLNSRILYSYAAAYLHSNNKNWLEQAHKAYRYLLDKFADPVNGGFYWALQADGKKHDGRKQVYGQAFAIYALAEYYKATNDKQALDLAIATFQLIEKHSYDSVFGGYLEAHGECWEEIEDLRLSEKDQNDKKSMNTHLHVIEAYANLYSVWPSATLKAAITQLLQVFDQHIINKNRNHLNLFFDKDWTIKSNDISFGHDIEAAWLLLEAAEIIADTTATTKFKQLAISLADGAAEGLQANGGLWYEYSPQNQHWVKEYHWWPQAEALVGWLNAWQISKNQTYLDKCIASWHFIQSHIKDHKHGEWYWGVDAQLKVIPNYEKAGFWKCPYHNSRACLEIIKRLKTQ